MLDGFTSWQMSPNSGCDLGFSLVFDWLILGSGQDDGKGYMI
jgi:hypothetical protein